MYIAVIVNASTITVINTNDSGAGSLRQALSGANNGDTINFSVTGVITVSSLLDISKDVVIVGPGANLLAIDGNNTTTVFKDQNYAINTVVISGLEIRNGSSGAYGAGIGGFGYDLTVKYCNIHSNTLSAGYGAAISVLSTGSSLTIENSTLHDNTSSGYGTCIYIREGGDLNISNSTIYNNNGSFTGQAIYAEGSDISLTNVTIAGHTTGSSAIDINDYEDFMTPSNNKAASITLVNCIIDNSINNYSFYSMMGGTETSLGYNISNDNTMSDVLTQTGDLNNTSSLLDPNGLQNNGGTTPTVDLECGSPAIDAGTLVLTLDQIDSVRYGSGPDIGAYERPQAQVAAAGTDTRTEDCSFTWIDGNTYTTSNNTATYNIVGGAANGCDSLVTLDLTINNQAVDQDYITGIPTTTSFGDHQLEQDNNRGQSFTPSITGNLCQLNVLGNIEDADFLCFSNDSVGLIIEVQNGDGFSGSILGISDTLYSGLIFNSVLEFNFSITIPISSGSVYTWELKRVSETCEYLYVGLDAEDNGSYSGGVAYSFGSPAGGQDILFQIYTCCNENTSAGILDYSLGDKLIVYPNPTSGNFSIDLGNTYENISVTILDITGRVVGSRIVQESPVLNLSLDEPSGTYLVSIEAGDKKAVIRLVKE